MKLANNLNRQIELTLVTETRPRRQPPLRPYQRRRQIAFRWFQEMHRVVDEALTPLPARTAARPVQATLALAGGS